MALDQSKRRNGMNRNLLVAAIVTALVALACSPWFNVPHYTGPTETFTFDEPLPAGESVADVDIRMGAGSLDLRSGAAGLAQGTISYNIAEWEPTVTRTGDHLRIEQGTPDPNFAIPGHDIVNEWDLRLGDVPMRLSLMAGAYSGSLDLTGLRLRSLDIDDGASDATVSFDSPNSVEMDDLSYSTGASSVTLRGLGNANFDTMSFEGGAGTYTLDFSGELQRDGTVHIATGVSTVRVEIPAGVSARVTLTGTLHDVTTVGSWSQHGNVYETEGFGPSLRISVDIGLGSLTLVTN
jgi:hypothetical protein